MHYGNGFYAAMKTDESVQTVYIDEVMFRATLAQAEARKRAARQKARRRKADAAANREKRRTIRTVKQELGTIATAVLVAWGGSAGLIDPVLWVPLVLGLHSLICVRAGRWMGRNSGKK